MPPLNGLKAFEVVANKGAFNLAAEELCVTQSAVGQQIKNLESYLGFKLFDRQAKGLVLTEQGARLKPAVSEAFSLILKEIDELDRPRNTVDIRTSSSFASSWLMPRLLSFEKSQPEISVRLIAGERDPLQNHRKAYGIEVVYEEYVTHDMGNILIEEWLLPLCSPTLLEDKEPISLNNLAKHRLLLNSPNGRDWMLWAEKIGHPDLVNKKLRGAMQLPTDSVAIDMACAGYGIALANLHYAQHHIKSGQLVPATNFDFQQLGAHFLVSDKKHRTSADEVLVDWLRREAAESTRLSLTMLS